MEIRIYQKVLHAERLANLKAEFSIKIEKKKLVISASNFLKSEYHKKKTS